VQKNSQLRDLIYFDFDKAASILSQVEMGLLKETTSTNEKLKEERNIRKYGVAGVFTPEFGGIESDKKASFQSKILHHDLLVRVEELIFEQGFALDINEINAQSVDQSSNPSNFIREQIRDTPYIRAEGLAAIEDYQRIKRIAEKFNEILEPIRESQRHSIKQTNEYQEAKRRIDERRSEANETNDRNRKRSILDEVKKLEQELERLVESVVDAGVSQNIPSWLIDAVGLFIDTFIPGRLNIRIYPFQDFPKFHVVANLKRDCFIDSDLENILFAYGTQTNMKLTVVGIVTSLPSESGDLFNPMKEFDEEFELQSTQEREFEKAFRGLFVGFQGFEKFMRFVNYPSVAIYPLAVYRTIRSNRENLTSNITVTKSRKSRANKTGANSLMGND
jgi:hypothetical protein